MEKVIFCYCHGGGENILAADGSILYKGGITDFIQVYNGMKFEELKASFFDRLKINPEGIFLHFTVKYDPKQIISLKDDMSVQTLIACNDDFAHIYASITEDFVLSSICTSNERLNLDSSSPSPCGEIPSNRNVSGIMMPTDKQSQLFIGERWKYIIIGEGQVFEDANSFRNALFRFSIAHKFSYKYTHNKPKFLRAKCGVETCKWEMTVAADGKTNNVSIRRMHKEHSHSIEDVMNFKPKFRARLMVDVVVDKLFNTPTYFPRQICKDIMDEYQMALTYKQAWKSKEEALHTIDGKIEDSYKIIPWYCSRLMEVIPNTIAKWSSHDDGTFNQLFVSYGCSINGFHNGCRPLIFIDGCHLSGPYRGTLLAASALDAGNGMYPLAYGVVTSECDEDWLWFLQHLKRVVRDKDIVIVSDRNPAILKGVDTLFGSDNHGYCYRHLQENFSSFINKNAAFKLNSAAKERAHGILDEIAYARTIENYHKAIQKMLNFQTHLHDWVLQNNPQHWSNALFPKQRWDWLNSNIAESFNAWMGEARHYPIGKLMQAHAAKYAELLSNKVQDLKSWRNGFGKRIEDRIKENIARGQGFSVKSRPPNEFEVYERRKGVLVVNFSLHTCTCMEWQMTGIPCPHACCAIRMHSCSVYECLSNCYRKEVQEKIYANLMPGIPTIDMPSPANMSVASFEDNSQAQCALLPPKTKRAPGRPRKKRIESQFLNKRLIRCSRCGNGGHNRSSCKEPIIQN